MKTANHMVIIPRKEEDTPIGHRPTNLDPLYFEIQKELVRKATARAVATIEVDQKNPFVFTASCGPKLRDQLP